MLAQEFHQFHAIAKRFDSPRAGGGKSARRAGECETFFTGCALEKFVNISGVKTVSRTDRIDGMDRHGVGAPFLGAFSSHRAFGAAFYDHQAAEPRKLRKGRRKIGGSGDFF